MSQYDQMEPCSAETKAMSLLKAAGYEQHAGVYYHPDNANGYNGEGFSVRPETEEETEALNYLCGEWDYATESRPEEIQKLIQKKLDKEVKL